MQDNDGQSVLPAFERAQMLLRAGELGAARREAQAALDAYGPDAGLYLVLGRAHAAEDEDDHDRHAERAYRTGLDAFPDHLDLLAAYAEFGRAGDAMEEPGRVARGKAAADRVRELAPGSPQARELDGPARTGTARRPGAAAVQRHDARMALAEGVDARTAAGQAAQAADAWPYDRRLAVRAETLAALARPGAVLARARVRAPYLYAAAVAVLGSALALGVPALDLPTPTTFAAAAALLPGLQERRLLRRARARAAARLPVDYREPAPGAPEIPPATGREMVVAVLSAVVALGALAGSLGWSAAKAAEYPRYEASVPESYRGMPLRDDGTAAAILDFQLDEASLPSGVRPFSGIYEDQETGSRLVLIGVTGDLHDEDPDRFFEGMFEGFDRPGSERTDQWSADPGELGGRMECVTAEMAAGGSTTCMWLDKGSMGTVMTGAYPDGDHSTLPRIARDLREATLRPTDPGAA
ncbi:tetratricopeptide repeat protein [Streptomyces sp. NPDC050418]|uniref:tetratricopeptide repeat protein n=1 Tax=Streptomyces sp. NPDC050418 TaxID=3365612 RepID=UPI003795F961